MKIQWKSGATGKVLVLSGVLDHTAETGLSAAAAAWSGAALAIDLDKVDPINSLGAAAWRKFLDQIGATAKVELYNCRSAFMDFAVMLPKAVAAATIKSFYAAYACGECSRFIEHLVTADELKQFRKLPTVTCTCGGGAATDTDAEDFLSLIERD